MKRILAIATAAAALTASAAEVAHFNMEVRSGQIVETVSGNRFAVQGHFAPENVAGAVGKALRFDGYTSWVDASLGNIIPESSKDMTVSVWTAIESYPIVLIDQYTDEKIAIINCLDDDARSGFGFFVGFNGEYTFKTYIGGWPIEVKANGALPTYEWNHLVAVVNSSSRTVKLYNNGTEVGSTRGYGTIDFKGGHLIMGRGPAENYTGPFLLTSFDGLIDDITVYDEALDPATLYKAPENKADLSIPASRFADDLLRPRFHGMPAAGWTNECHGMVWADGRYHLFFQKNANGPYMARLHWGHISSENLFDWREEKIAIAPGAPYDIKGCWSGCVFTDDELTGGKPNILYTAVDYGKATIAQATPDDPALDNWTKLASNPIIGGRPSGLSDDFRDPYFFRNGSDAYIIVGSAANGIGTTTLHHYDAASRSWTNNGLFFSGTSQSQDGTFWEMPNITPMPDGKWLFTATPIGTATGVHTMYWTGSIGADGRFNTTQQRGKDVELASRDGFGLLSPTIYNHEGKTIALGIVPDKLSSQDNWNLGWAHCYSLPREWSLDANGELVQKPFEGLRGMRSATSYSADAHTIDGIESLAPVSGRAAEIEATFTVGNSDFGFRIFKNSGAAGVITYSPVKGELTADFSRLARLINDSGVYNGIYRCTLPTRPAVGTELKLNIFIDHSIIDIFINDRWATSIRVFPIAEDADGIEAFGSGAAVKSLRAWTLSADGNSGVDHIEAPAEEWTDDTVYNLQGMPVGHLDGLQALPRGIYIAKGKKVLVK